MIKCSEQEAEFRLGRSHGHWMIEKKYANGTWGYISGDSGGGFFVFKFFAKRAMKRLMYPEYYKRSDEVDFRSFLG